MKALILFVDPRFDTDDIAAVRAKLQEQLPGVQVIAVEGFSGGLVVDSPDWDAVEPEPTGDSERRG